MTLNRRQAIVLSAGVAAVVFGRLHAHAGEAEAEALLAEFTGGVEPREGRIVLELPEVAENGNAVPLSFRVESTMSGEDLVESVIVVSDGNPRPDVALFHFSELSGVAAASTRIRLARTQAVTAVAKMADGSLFADRREITVTVGGCVG